MKIRKRKKKTTFESLRKPLAPPRKAFKARKRSLLAKAADMEMKEWK